jgi:hypothetical protein
MALELDHKQALDLWRDVTVRTVRADEPEATPFASATVCAA